MILTAHAIAKDHCILNYLVVHDATRLTVPYIKFYAANSLSGTKNMLYIWINFMHGIFSGLKPKVTTQQEVIFLKSNPRVYDATLGAGCGYNEIVISYNEI